MSKSIYLDNFNYYGFDHKSVFKKFKVDKYIGTFEIKNNVHAVYYSENPDKSKGHNHYIGLTNNYIVGLDDVILNTNSKKLTQNGIQCRICYDVMYSLHRHDYRVCECGSVSIDGGTDYVRTTGDLEHMKPVIIDLLNGTYHNFIDVKVLDSIATELSDYCAKWGRFGGQAKEKYGTVRFYAYFDFSLHSLVYPRYSRSRVSKWLWNLDISLITPLFRPLSNYWLKYQQKVYRDAYKRVLEKYPDYREEILGSADYKTLLEGL